MTDQKRTGRSLLLSESQELRRMFAHRVPVECKIAGAPEAVQDREQQQGIV